MGQCLSSLRTFQSSDPSRTSSPTHATLPATPPAPSATSPFIKLSSAPSPADTALPPAADPSNIPTPTSLTPAPSVTTPHTTPSIPTQRTTNDAPSTMVASSPTTTLSSAEPKYSVFISHAGEDKATIALPLREKLRERGISAFVDEADMEPGTDAQQAMLDAMETTPVAVVVLSPEFIARKWPMKELMCFLRRRKECAAAGRVVPVVIPCFYRLTIEELYHEPRFDRTDKDGELLYQKSRFYERQKRGEPEADVAAIKAALRSLHGIMGVRNDVDASNESSYLMTYRRDLLLRQLCEKVAVVVPAGALNMQTTNESTQSRQEASSDGFRKCFPISTPGARAVLDCDDTDEDGNPKTPEGLVKHHLLENSNDDPKLVSIHGIGGVGKSTILRALSVDKQIRSRFRDGVHIITLGEDASTAKFVRQIFQVLKDSGAEKTYPSLEMETDLNKLLCVFEKWFEGKSCAFLIDDVWERGIEVGLLSRLCSIGSTGRSGVLITTREHEIASLAPCGQIVELKSREVRGFVSRQILFLHAGRQESSFVSVSVNDSINRILDICAGLPVSLAVAGKNVKKMEIGMSKNKEAVWTRYLSQLVICRDKLLQKDVPTSWGTYKNLFATFASSISCLDEKCREDSLGFASKVSFEEMHWRLCVLRKQDVVPASMLRHLWETESDEQADVIATAFAESGLASIEVVWSGKEYMTYLRLHDSLHDFAVAEASRTGHTKNAHECVLDGYKSSDAEICCEAHGTPRWWSESVESDGYIHANVCRHLMGAGRAGELVRLLMSPQWAERQLKINGILSLEADFALGIIAIRNAMRYGSDQEWAEMETVLRLISQAVNLSSPFLARNIAEFPYQVHGRLKRYAERYVAIREYMNRIETEGAKPLIVCKSSFLGEGGGAHKQSISVGTGVQCMAVMKDGERVACGCGDGRIFVVNTKLNQVERQWQAHDDAVFAIAVGRGDTRVVSGSSATAKVWEVGSGRCVSIFDDHSGRVNGVTVMGDGRRVISVSDDGTARVWDMETGQVLSNPFTVHNGDKINCVAVLKDGEDLVVTGGNDSKLRIWNISSSAQDGDAFGCHNDRVRCVAVTPDGRNVVSGSDYDTVKVWDVGSHQQIGDPLKGDTWFIGCVCVTGRRLVTGSGLIDFRIRVWDLESRTEICDPLMGHRDWVWGVAFLARDDCIVSCSLDGTIRVWDVTQRKTKKVANWYEFVSSVSFSPDGKLVVSGSHDKTLRIWDSTTEQQVGKPLKGHSQGVHDVAVTADGRYILSVSDDRTLRVWNLASHKLLHTLTGHTDSIRCVAVTPRGDRAVTGSHDETIRVWDLRVLDGSHFVLEGHSTSVWRVFVTDDGLRIISVDWDDNVFVWGLQTKQVVKRFTQESARTLSRREILNLVGEKTTHDDTALSIPLYGREIVYGEGPDATVLATMEAGVWSWALSPDTKTICAGLKDGQVVFMKLVR